MHESILVSLLIMGVIAITAVVFGGWLLVTFFRLIGRCISAIFAPPAPRPPRAMGQNANQNGLVCARQSCRALNLPTARFCRRCGQQIAANSRYRLQQQPMV